MPKPNLISVGQENKRLCAMLGAERVRVIGGLALAFKWITARTLCLDNCERPAESIE